MAPVARRFEPRVKTFHLKFPVFPTTAMHLCHICPINALHYLLKKSPSEYLIRYKVSFYETPRPSSSACQIKLIRSITMLISAPIQHDSTVALCHKAYHIHVQAGVDFHDRRTSIAMHAPGAKRTHTKRVQWQC